MAAKLYTLPTYREPPMDKKQLAKHLNISTRWVEKKMKEGLPYVVLGKGRHSSIRFRLSDVEAWLEPFQEEGEGARATEEPDPKQQRGKQGEVHLFPYGERWVDRKTLAKHFSVSPRWVSARMKEGMPYLPLGPTPRSGVRFRISEAEEFVNRNNHKTPQEDPGGEPEKPSPDETDEHDPVVA